MTIDELLKDNAKLANLGSYIADNFDTNVQTESEIAFEAKLIVRYIKNQLEDK